MNRIFVLDIRFLSRCTERVKGEQASANASREKERGRERERKGKGKGKGEGERKGKREGKGKGKGKGEVMDEDMFQASERVELDVTMTTPIVDNSQRQQRRQHERGQPRGNSNEGMNGVEVMCTGLSLSRAASMISSMVDSSQGRRSLMREHVGMSSSVVDMIGHSEKNGAEYAVALCDENRAKNRYTDVLPCKFIVLQFLPFIS